MAGAGLVGYKDRHVLNVFKVIETVGLGDVLGSAQNVQDGRVELDQVFFLHSGSRGA